MATGAESQIHMDNVCRQLIEEVLAPGALLECTAAQEGRTLFA